MLRRKGTKTKVSTISVDGHYEAEETAGGNRRAWVPDQLVVGCGCGKEFRPARYPHSCECGINHTALVHNVERVLAENSVALQGGHYEEEERSTRVVYEADDILGMLTGGPLTAPRANVANPAAGVPDQDSRGTTTLDDKDGLPFSLEDAIVIGGLNLKHRNIERPIVVSNCWFMDQLDLRYCEFKHAVCFLDCAFYGQFNSGDTTESLTIYRKELNCIGSSFKKAASFNGIKVESTAYFHNTSFELEAPEKVPEYLSLSAGYPVDFAMASFGHHLECTDAVFEGDVSFNSIKCGGNAQIDNAFFKKGADFTAASFGWNFECANAEFVGPAIFNSLRCDGNGHFDRTRFRGEADFTAASFGRNLECSKTRFEGPAYLNSLTCGGVGFIDSAVFGDEADLKYSSWKAPLVCEDTRFQGQVDCSAMSCARDANFINTRFESGQSVVFCDASFGGDLRCERALFNGTVKFKGLRCEGAGDFQNTTFVGPRVDYQSAHFGSDLDLRGTYFAGRVRLARVSIRNRLRLGASCFRGEVELYDSEIGILELIDANYPISRDPLRSRIMDEFRTRDKRGKEQKVFAEVVANDWELRCRLRRERLKEAAKRLGGVTERVLRELTCSLRELRCRLRKERLKEAAKKLEGVTERLDARIPHIELKRQLLREELFPFRPDTLTLTDIRFERFHGGPNRELAWELALRFCEGQDPEKFSRDPYMQLEKYYNSIGEDDDALDIHYRGHCALRENAKASRSKSRDGRVNWPWPKIWTTDLVWKWLTGYGQKMHRLLVTFLVFVTAGTIAFWSQQTLVLPPAGKITAGDQQGWPVFLDRIVYSVDLLIPVLDLRAGDTRIVDSALWFYEVVHIFAGWLLVALLIAWITAIAKGNR